MERLQKYLARAGVASRRHSETLIRQGRVTVDGEPAQLGMKVDGSEQIRVNGIRVDEQAPVYLMLNKPVGVITTSDDPQGRETVLDLIDTPERVYPVGRLDQDTTGLLLVTNDGELSHRLMHPSFEIDKTYEAMVRGRVTRATARRLAEGIELEDGMTAPATCELVSHGREHSHLRLTIHEGRNRQVRRMMDAVGHEIIDLARSAYGPLKLGNLRPGRSRPLQPAEVRRLYKQVGLAPKRAKRD